MEGQAGTSRAAAAVAGASATAVAGGDVDGEGGEEKRLEDIVLKQCGARRPCRWWYLVPANSTSIDVPVPSH
ncbi:hypothetical protein KPH14_006004 [Odynerus spinipes]|uniref:Uncharacterized protein n=1 Tax=Odynerus spinipes TaxID=1348599 RepID=A0AAD9VP57_9HYME|nr:hypothetical protein KPH14_006004 [Odynerus spinipes]